jgi:chromosome segregation ATPase
MDDKASAVVNQRKRRLGATLYAALKSRSRWKNKVADLRKTIKSRDVELRDVRASQEKWKSDAAESRRRVRELEEEAARLREQVGEVKKKSSQRAESHRPRMQPASSKGN